MARGPLTMLPRSVLGLAKEVARHLLRRPVVGVAAAARTGDGRWLPIRRGDTGAGARPGGALEWRATLRTWLGRARAEEAGVATSTFERVLGVWSRPDRDPRFHAVTIVAALRVEAPDRPRVNPLEVRE